MARHLTLYRDDSTAQVVYKNVKTFFWTADNTVLVISLYTGVGDDHYYVHWPRERFCWFKDDPHVEAYSSIALADSAIPTANQGR